MTRQDRGRVLVLGAGIVGVTTAYYLARAGFRVTIIDRATEVAADGSHANGGTVSSFHAKSWANSAAPLQFLKSLFDRGSIFRLRLKPDLAFALWAACFLRYCLPGASAGASKTLLNLVVETQSLLKEICAEARIDPHISQGGLYLHATEKSLESAMAACQGTEYDAPTRLLNRSELLALEPALERSKTKHAGALWVERDFSADCRAFASSLANHLVAVHGVTVQLSREVTGLAQVNGRVRGVRLGEEILDADQIVVCLGVGTPCLTRTLSHRPRIYPVKGYSLTLPIVRPDLAPRHFAVDESVFTAYSVLGDRFRLATYVEFAGYDRSVDPKAIRFLTDVAGNLFPEAFDLGAAQGHACLRPMTPDGAPIVGGIPRHPNVWINAGHGHKGWATCCATANRLVHQMTEQ